MSLPHGHISDLRSVDPHMAPMRLILGRVADTRLTLSSDLKPPYGIFFLILAPSIKSVNFLKTILSTLHFLTVDIRRLASGLKFD